MRIALRTSGGRGEYELAGTQGDVAVSDLLGLQLCYEVTPEIVISGRALATQAQGKPRIRLLSQQNNAIHLYRILAAVLLLPKPLRELKRAHGSKLLFHEAYAMTAIKVDVAAIDRSHGRVVLRPTDILLGNAAHEEASLGVSQRMSRILRVWKAVETGTDPLSVKLRQHRDVVRNPTADHKQIEQIAHDIAHILKTESDVLPVIETQLFGQSSGVLGEEDYIEWRGLSVWDSFGVQDDLTPIAAKRQRVKQWRLVAVRGAEGTAFRKAISEGYDFRCAFSGIRLPKMNTTDSSGVDAAHILPWATHNINAPTNGVCLSKQCHWAFDEGVLKMDWDRSCNVYVLSIPREVEKSARASRFDLAGFQSMAGSIPRKNLPHDETLWPDIHYLEALNRFMFPPC